MCSRRREATTGKGLGGNVNPNLRPHFLHLVVSELTTSEAVKWKFEGWRDVAYGAYMMVVRSDSESGILIRPVTVCILV